MRVLVEHAVVVQQVLGFHEARFAAAGLERRSHSQIFTVTADEHYPEDVVVVTVT